MAANPLPAPGLPDGWFNHGAKILELLDTHRPRVVVELGSWMGASAIPMARSVRRWGGTVTLVDTWSGTLDAAEGPPMMILSCARKLVDAGVAPWCRLVPARTLEAAHAWPTPIDFLYIDADHSEAGCGADLRAWAPLVRPGGVIAGDDYNHRAFPGVRPAWDTYAAANGLELTRYQSTPPHPEGIELVYTVKGTPS